MNYKELEKEFDKEFKDKSQPEKGIYFTGYTLEDVKPFLKAKINSVMDEMIKRLEKIKRGTQGL